MQRERKEKSLKFLLFFFCKILLTILYYMTYSIKHKIVLLKKQYYGEKRKRGGHMVFNTGAALLDAIVLAVVSKENEGTYGYKITQDVR